MLRRRCGFGGRFGNSVDIPAVMRFMVLSSPNPNVVEVCRDGWTRGSGFRIWVSVWEVVSSLGLNRMAYEIKGSGDGGERNPTGLQVWVWGWIWEDLKR